MAKKQDRQIARELTLDEYDELTFSNQLEGARYERRDIINELYKKVEQLKELRDFAPAGELDASVEWHYLASGLSMAINIIRSMDNLEERAGCSECGSI